MSTLLVAGLSTFAGVALACVAKLRCYCRYDAEGKRWDYGFGFTESRIVPWEAGDRSGHSGSLRRSWREELTPWSRS